MQQLLRRLRSLQYGQKQIYFYSQNCYLLYKTTIAPVCKEACSAYGTCVNGQCQCSSGWRGPTCSGISFIFYKINVNTTKQISNIFKDKGQIIVIVTNSTRPSVVVTPVQASTSQNIVFSVSITKLIEKDSSNNVIKSVSLESSDQNYTYNNYTLGDSSNIVWDYSAALENGAIVNITVSIHFLFFNLILFDYYQFIQFKEPYIYEFYNDTTEFFANTLKVNFKVSFWPFASISNTLHVQMDNLVDSDDEPENLCISEDNDQDGFTQWLKINVNDVALYPFILFIYFYLFISMTL